LAEDEECLELVPHITLNPSFNIEMLEHISPDYNESRWRTVFAQIRVTVLFSTVFVVNPDPYVYGLPGSRFVIICTDPDPSINK
jgi:hypothetical protein